MVTQRLGSLIYIGRLIVKFATKIIIQAISYIIKRWLTLFISSTNEIYKSTPGKVPITVIKAIYAA